MAPLACRLTDAIGVKESRDIVHDIDVLDRIASSPAPIKTSMVPSS